MIILGLTGSIGMGKSTTAKNVRRRGHSVHDSDATVHRLYAGKAAGLIEAEFPGTVSNGVVDRRRLAAAVLNDQEKLRRLGEIVHPLVRAEQDAFVARHRNAARRSWCSTSRSCSRWSDRPGRRHSRGNRVA